MASQRSTWRGSAAPVAGNEPSEAPVSESRRSSRVPLDLVPRIQSGDEDAAIELVERYQRLVAKLLLHVLGPHDELQDHVHDVLADVLASVHQLREPAALTVWVQRVAVSRARNILRSKQRRRGLAFRPPEELPELSTHDDTDAREDLQQLYRVLDELAPALRLPFTLRFLNGLELTQVADLCGCSLATVKRRLRKAQHRFVQLARTDVGLAERLSRGSRWEDAP